MMTKDKTEILLSGIRNGENIALRQKIDLTLRLSLPAIMAQLSSILMQYIDASMVGHLGANESASIGLVSTTTWLFGGLCSAAATGFSVQVAHKIGAGDNEGAKAILCQSFVAISVFCAALMIIAYAISPFLPGWLGGVDAIRNDASIYFLIFALSILPLQIVYLAGSMLRCSGNMKVPSILNVVMCMLDVVFNALLIFPTQQYRVFGYAIDVPGAGLGVMGAALGTTIAEVVTAALMLYYLVIRSDKLRLKGVGRLYRLKLATLKNAFHIGMPMGLQFIAMNGAQILITSIVAPLGVLSIAANSFAVTAESICYMPGFGVADAATTLIGQCLGAGRKSLMHSFAYISVSLGMIVMTLMGLIMYVAAPSMMEIMTSNHEIQTLGVMALRIEAFAEPMFAAAIVTYGVFVGAGYTVVPSIMNLASMWAVRLTLAAILAPELGLKGVWVAMCVELIFRGIMFLTRLRFGQWSAKIEARATN